MISGFLVFCTGATIAGQLPVQQHLLLTALGLVRLVVGLAATTTVSQRQGNRVARAGRGCDQQGQGGAVLFAHAVLLAFPVSCRSVGPLV